MQGMPLPEVLQAYRISFATLWDALVEHARRADRSARRIRDRLRARTGRTVGVISHVESMQEQIPAQVVVEQTPAGPSRIR